MPLPCNLPGSGLGRAGGGGGVSYPHLFSEILALGDSITGAAALPGMYSFYHHLLRERCNARFDIIPNGSYPSIGHSGISAGQMIADPSTYLDPALALATGEGKAILFAGVANDIVQTEDGAESAAAVISCWDYLRANGAQVIGVTPTGRRDGSYAAERAVCSNLLTAAARSRRMLLLPWATAYADGDDTAFLWRVGAITAFADAGGGNVTVTSANHGRTNGMKIVISGTTNYNGTFTVANVTTNTFTIVATWSGNDATGIFRWWDGIHPNPRGHAAIANVSYTALLPYLAAFEAPNFISPNSDIATSQTDWTKPVGISSETTAPATDGGNDWYQCDYAGGSFGASVQFTIPTVSAATLAAYTSVKASVEYELEIVSGSEEIGPSSEWMLALRGQKASGNDWYYARTVSTVERTAWLDHGVGHNILSGRLETQPLAINLTGTWTQALGYIRLPVNAGTIRIRLRDGGVVGIP